VNIGDSDSTSYFRNEDTVKFVNMRIAEFEKNEEIWPEKVSFFIEDKTKVENRVLSVERRVVYFSKLLFLFG